MNCKWVRNVEFLDFACRVNIILYAVRRILRQIAALPLARSSPGRRQSCHEVLCRKWGLERIQDMDHPSAWALGGPSAGSGLPVAAARSRSKFSGS